jgi:hypothetical protein
MSGSGTPKPPLLNPDQFMIEADITADPHSYVLVLKCLHPDCHATSTPWIREIGSGALLGLVHLVAGDHTSTVHRARPIL